MAKIYSYVYKKLIKFVQKTRKYSDIGISSSDLENPV